MLKKVVLLCFLSFISFNLSVYPQGDEKIEMTMKKVPLKELFNTVEKEYGYSFMYSNTEIDDQQIISVEEKSGTIKSLLDKAFNGKNISYEIVSNKIILKSASKGTKQQSTIPKTVTGVITDDAGEAIIGASVSVKGTTRGTMTDADGKYSLDVAEGETIVVSFVGYISQEINFKRGKLKQDFSLAEDNRLLDEVVVIGYGTLKKSDLTGALSSVDTKDLASKATTNPAEALQGLVPGVSVLKEGGMAGAEISVKIRGVNTFGDNEPLYIIDGFQGNISSVNPNDIASMEVLKDAAAAAIYGSVAANGVVIVTTKAGKAGKIQVDLNSFISVTKTAKRLEMLNAQEYVTVHRRMYDEYNKYASKQVALPGYLSDPGTHDTDWQDEVFRTGLSMNQSIAVRGGQDNTKFSVSANLSKDKGIIIDNNFLKQNARMKVSTKKNIFTIDANLAFTATKSKRPNFSLKEAYMISPLVPVYDNQNKDGYGLTNWGDMPNNVNVVADEHFKDSRTKKQDVEGNASIGVDIWDGLTFKTSYSYRGYNTQYYYHRPPYTADPKVPNEYTYHEETRTYWQEQTFDNLLNYSKIFDKHSVNAMLGTSYTLRESTWNSIAVEGKNVVDGKEISGGFLDPNFGTVGAGKGGTFSGDGTKWEYNRMSYFGRVNYSFDNRYLLQFTFRRDGSSKFASKNRYGNFPSVALGWRINEEAFFPQINWLSNLKLRASWGKLGNEVALGYYDTEALIYTANDLTLGYVQGSGSNPWPGSIAIDLEDKTLKWETTVSKNLGLDFGFLENKLAGSINYYNNTTEDLLIRKRMAPSAGIKDPTLNVGKIRNSGIEFDISYTDKVGDFSYNVGFNISTLKNKVLALADDNQILYGEGLKFDTEHFPTQTRVGEPIGAFFLYKTNGIFQTDAEVQNHKNSSGALLQPNAKPGDIRFADTNGDGTIDDNDKVYAGTGMPKAEINIRLGASFRNFDFTALIGSGWGHKIYNGNRYFYEGMNSGSNFLKSSLNS